MHKLKKEERKNSRKKGSTTKEKTTGDWDLTKEFIKFQKIPAISYISGKMKGK